MSFSRDWDLQQRVSNFLGQRNVVRRGAVQVDAAQGLITLRGQVGSYYEKQLVLNACQHVAGVISIVDEIAVVGEATPEPLAVG